MSPGQPLLQFLWIEEDQRRRVAGIQAAIRLHQSLRSIAMAIRILRFLAVLLTAVMLGAGLAHLFEMPHKINLSRDEYLTVQQIYRGWALLGIALIGALIITLILAIAFRKAPAIFPLTLTALLSLAGSLAIFFIFTYPANQQTANWTVMPANWQELRAQWEYSHAVNALLYLVALSALVWSLLAPQQRRGNPLIK
jgi:hypothetical protein